MAAMLHRSASSRRRRPSKSGCSSPQAPRSGSRSAGTSPGRRASIAVSPIDYDRGNGGGGNRSGNLLGSDLSQRSPRHSIIPDIALNLGDVSSDEEVVIPCSPRRSLTPEVGGVGFNRSPRGSLVPKEGNSRNSLCPEGFNRSPRNSIALDGGKSPHLTPEYSNRSPRGSLVPDSGSRVNLSDFNRSPRNSITPTDGLRSPRKSITNLEHTWANNSSPPEDSPPPINRSPRHSIAPDISRTPRGSIAMDRISPRGSIAGDYMGNRSPRGSIAHEYNRTPRGSVSKISPLLEGVPGGEGRSPRTSPRGSLSLALHESGASHDVRRYSADNVNGRRNCVSPYRNYEKERSSREMGSTTSALSESGSRRPSSSVGPQDEQRRLFNDTNSSMDCEEGKRSGTIITHYGSVTYQLKDANIDANNTLEFVCKALRIIYGTTAVTVTLVCLFAVPILMLIMGIKHFRDCPREPHIPVYMVTGGCMSCMMLTWLLWNQLHSNPLVVTGLHSKPSITLRLIFGGIGIFLIVWFSLGNYWILRIKWPEYTPTMFEPNRWCDINLYVFGLVHLLIVYGLLVAMVVLAIVLAVCQVFGCSWLVPSATY